VVIQTQNKVC